LRSFHFYIGVTTVVIPRFKGIVPMLESCIKYKISLWCVVASLQLLFQAERCLYAAVHRCLVPPQVVLLCKDPGAKKYHAEIAKVRVRAACVAAVKHDPSDRGHSSCTSS
jgi:hypothetical protein